MLDALRRRGAAGNSRQAWLTALSRPAGALFATWIEMRGGSDERSCFTGEDGRRHRYITLTDAQRSVTMVLSEPELQIEGGGHRLVDALRTLSATPLLLVGHMDRTRTLIPAFVAIGCS